MGRGINKKPCPPDELEEKEAMMKKLGYSVICMGIACLMMAGFVSTAAATGNGYTPGSEGVLAGTVPPQGVHYRQYNVFYDTDTLKDDNGDKINNGFDLNVFAQAHRLIYISPKKILGADYGFSVILPVISTDFEVGPSGNRMKDSDIGVGDLFLEPLILGWHGPRYDIALGLGFNLPTGDFDSKEVASPGNGCWSSVLTLGGTWFFDSKKSLSASVLTRSVVYGEKDETDLEPGSEFIVDFGIGKELSVAEGFLLRPGLCGYGFWQITEDDGPGVEDEKGAIYAMGAEVNLFWLPPPCFSSTSDRFASSGLKMKPKESKQF